MLNRFRMFMYGRYGIDTLGVVLLVLQFVINFFARNNWIVQIVALALLGYVAFRFFSKDIVARRKENDFFLRYYTPAKNFLVKWNRRLQDTSHKYVKCPNCKQTLRLPKGRGKLDITCPKCGTKFVKKT